MAHKLKVGQKVLFSPSHQPNLRLTGTITGVSTDHDVVTVKAAKDGKAVEVEREFQAHASSVEVLSDAPARADAKEKTA